MKKSMKSEHKILHKKFQDYGKNAREWMLKCILMLPEIDDHRILEQKGFKSLTHYAAKLSGMGKHTVYDGLRILRGTVDMPNICKVIEKKGINIIKPILKLLTIENEKSWAEMAMKMSRHVLETYVRDLSRTGPTKNLEIPQEKAMHIFENDSFVSSEIAPKIPCEMFANSVTEIPTKQTVGMELSPEILKKLTKLKGRGGWDELFTQLLEEREEQLKKEKPAAVRSESRYIPIAILRYLLKRTNGTCAFPHCNNTFDDVHHTLRFSQYKMHDPDHMEILCEAHHSLAHFGLIDGEECAAENWRVLLEADTGAEKFEVDRLVARYRASSRS